MEKRKGKSSSMMNAAGTALGLATSYNSKASTSSPSLDKPAPKKCKFKVLKLRTILGLERQTHPHQKELQGHTCVKSRYQPLLSTNATEFPLKSRNNSGDFKITAPLLNTMHTCERLPLGFNSIQLNMLASHFSPANNGPSSIQL